MPQDSVANSCLNGADSFCVWTVINSPIVLAIVAFALTTLVGGFFARRWQRKSKELDLKIGIITKISDETMNILLSVQHEELNKKSLTQEQLSAAYRRWEIQQGIIATTIRAYFPEEALVKLWEDFSEHLTEVYALSGTSDPEFRSERLNKIKTYILDSNVGWGCLENISLRYSDKKEEWSSYQFAWFEIRKSILAKAVAIQQSILQSNVTTAL